MGHYRPLLKINCALVDSGIQFHPTNYLNFDKIGYAGQASVHFHTNWLDILSFQFHINRARDLFSQYITSSIVKIAPIKLNISKTILAAVRLISVYREIF